MNERRTIYILTGLAIILIIWQIMTSPRPFVAGTFYPQRTNSTFTQGSYLPAAANFYQTTTTTTSQDFNASSTSYGNWYGGSYGNSSPSLVLLGNNPDNQTFSGLGNYKEPGYVATDREDGTITSWVSYSDDYDYSTDCSNTWIRTYIVTDRNGATATARRYITGNRSTRACGTVSVDASSSL